MSTEYKLPFTAQEISNKLTKVNELSREKVNGTGIKNIIKLTQAEYDSMASHDSETLYVIEG